MSKRDQVVLFLSAGTTPSDPIRIMKGLFVWTQRACEGAIEEPEERFTFRPMNYGPCDPEVYRVVNQLVSEGFVEDLAVVGETWRKYRLTSRGVEASQRIEQQAGPRTLRFVKALREWCDQQSFSSLLRSVYHAYPQYATNSVLPHLRPNG